MDDNPDKGGLLLRKAGKIDGAGQKHPSVGWRKERLCLIGSLQVSDYLGPSWKHHRQTPEGREEGTMSHVFPEDRIAALCCGVQSGFVVL